MQPSGWVSLLQEPQLSLLLRTALIIDSKVFLVFFPHSGRTLGSLCCFASCKSCLFPGKSQFYLNFNEDCLSLKAMFDTGVFCIQVQPVVHPICEVCHFNSISGDVWRHQCSESKCHWKPVWFMWIALQGGNTEDGGYVHKVSLVRAEGSAWMKRRGQVSYRSYWNNLECDCAFKGESGTLPLMHVLSPDLFLATLELTDFWYVLLCGPESSTHCNMQKRQMCYKFRKQPRH